MEPALDSPLHAQSPPRRRRWRVVAALAIAATIVGVAVVAAADSGSTSGYRTTTVGEHEVEQSLTGVATIEPVSQAAVAFPAAGTVATVNVRVGDTVGVGAELASLDPTSLATALSGAQAALAQAELTLERARNGEAISGSGGGTAELQTVSFSSATGTASASIQLISAASSDDEELRQAQQAVINGQKRVDRDLAEADRALASAKQTCAAVGEDAEPLASHGKDTGGSDRDPPSDGDDSSDEQADVSACYRALSEVLAAQEQVASSQKALGKVAAELDQLLANRAEALAEQEATPAPTGAGGAQGPSGAGGAEGPSGDAGQPAPQQPQPAESAPGDGQSTAATPPSPAPTGDGGAQAPSGGGGQPAPQQPQPAESAPGDGQSTAATSPSSEDLIAYQKQVDAAAAQVAVAEQALRQATITSPIAGTVVAVNVAPGDTVSAASTTETIVVAGDGGYEAVTMVKVTDLPDLAVAQAATLVPDGSTLAVTGQVAAIGLVSTAGTTGTTYPVTIAFTGDTSTLRHGAAGALTITTAAVAAALAVPTSAVQLDDGRYTVTVLDGDETRDVTVEVGAIGATWTEVKEGLTRGQTVVLADLSEPLPGSATSTGGQQQQTPFGGGGRGGVGGFQPPRN